MYVDNLLPMLIIYGYTGKFNATNIILNYELKNNIK